MLGSCNELQVAELQQTIFGDSRANGQFVLNDNQINEVISWFNRKNPGASNQDDDLKRALERLNVAMLFVHPIKKH